MDATPKIPIVRKPSSMMETGPAGSDFATAAAARHPVDQLQRQGHPHDSPYRNPEFVRSVYGSAMAMEMTAERQMARREKQMGLDFVGEMYQDIVDGNDCMIDMSDFMSLPENRPEVSKAVMHPYMAKFLK